MSNLIHESEQVRENPTIFERVRFAVVQRINSCRRSIMERRKEYLEVRLRKRQFREDQLTDERQSSRIWKERLFAALDYDPTDVESGETEEPSISGAISQWFRRVILTRKIELGGILLVLFIGAICYYFISASNGAQNDLSATVNTATIGKTVSK